MDRLTSTNENQIEKFIQDAWYSGERNIIRSAEGSLAALVPIEDLTILEEFEKDSTESGCNRLKYDRKQQRQ